MFDLVLFAALLWFSPLKAYAQVDFLKGFGTLKGVIDQVQQMPTRQGNGIPDIGRAGDLSGMHAAGNWVNNAAAYCDAIKASPLVKEYVPVLGKAVKTRVTSFDADVRDAIDLRFDNSDEQLRMWVDAAPNPPGEPTKGNLSNFGRRVVAWASQCAAENNENDLFLFFLSDLRNPDAIAELRAKAKDAISSYGKVTNTTRLDVNGLPIAVSTRSKESLKFDLGYESGSFNVKDPLWVTMAAFALPNGTTAMESASRGRISGLSSRIDEAVVANEKKVIQVTAEQKQREKTDAQRVAEQAKVQASQDAAKNSPNGLLYQAYQAFQIVQTCSDVRKGYAAIYVSDAELSDAKDKMRKIEKTLKPKLVSELTDQIWNRASVDNADYFRGVKTATYTNGKSYCDLFKRDMTGVSQKVLGEYSH